VTKTIAFLLSDLQNGGTEWFAINLARNFKKRGYGVVFLLANERGDLLPLIREEFPIIGLGGDGYSLIGLCRSLPPLLRYLRQTPPDVMISGLPLVNMLAGVASFLAQSKTKLIVVEHIRLCPKATQTCWFRHILKSWMIKISHALATDYVCVSQTVARDLYKVFPKDRSILNKIIYNPIIPENFKELVDSPVDHPWLKKKREHPFPLCVSVGRLLKNKDYLTVIDAFTRLRQQLPQARLLILGEGEERAVLEASIREKNLEDAVSLPGPVPNVFPYLKAADLFVLASHSEAFGNVIVEALACGVPIVSTDSGGPREILCDGVYGKLVPVAEPAAMAQAMLETLESTPDRNKLQQRGLRFAVNEAADAYVRLFESLAV
ncbi:MAG: glycosyltransferase, partial [Bdellovibrionales bacterium]